MEYGLGVVLIFAGLVGASALIAAKSPNAGRIIQQLVPLAAIIGVLAIIFSIAVIAKVGPKAIFELAKQFPLMGASYVVGALCGLALGFMFVVPLMAQMGAGQQRAQQLAEQIAPFQMLIGLVAIVAGLMIVLFRSGVLPPTFPSGVPGL